MEDPELVEKRGSAFATCFFAVRKALAGMFGIVCAEPAVATLEDVQYIFPSNYTSSREKGFSKDVPRMGRSVIMPIRREN